MDSFLEKLEPDERTGSKPRCHWLTHGAPGQVANRLNALAEPWGSVSADDHWMPEGVRRIQEAQLDKAARLLPKQDRGKLRDWWLAVSRPHTRTPNWDIASTCTVDRRTARCDSPETRRRATHATSGMRDHVLPGTISLVDRSNRSS